MAKSLSAPELGSRIAPAEDEPRPIARQRVKTYVRSAYRKMGVTSRARAVAWGMENGLKPDR